MVAVSGAYPSVIRVGKVIRVPLPTSELIAPAPSPASVISATSNNDIDSTLRGAARSAALAFLPHPHVDPDRAAREPELFAQAPFQETAVAGLEEPGGEQHERRGARSSLGGEQDPRLFSAAHRRRGRGDDLFEEGVEPSGGHPGVPGSQRRLQDRKSVG